MQTEDVFRSANERIAEKGRELRWRFPVPFLCECADRQCFVRVELTLEAYAELRSHPQRYLTAPGHRIVGAIVIEQTEGMRSQRSSTRVTNLKPADELLNVLLI